METDMVPITAETMRASLRSEVSLFANALDDLDKEARMYGIGWINMKPDGSVEFVDAEEQRRANERQADAEASPAPRHSDPPHEQSQTYTGSLCMECGSPRMVRSGACETCQDCGATSGCG